jgi:hypothetical protein
MAINGIGPGGGSAASLQVLRLALRQTQPGAGDPAAAPAPAAGVQAPVTPDAAMQDIVARAQFSASLRVASTAVENVATVLQTYDAAAPAAA